MTDSKKNAEQLAETWLEAMSILSKKQIESVSFDKTIEATVTDASRASEGIYIVSTGNASFTAYTTEVGYKNNDAVMVTIPQGNYDKQKIIIGKQVNKQDGLIIYKSPFQQFINVSNNLIYGECSTSYYANGPIDSIWGKQWDITVQNFIDSNAYKQYPYTEDNVEKISQYGLIWDSGDIFEQGFTRLGLSAQFSTWLSEYDIISGNYGIVLQITFKCVDPQANNANNTFDKFLIFDSNEFLGDVYNFETYYTQEKLFDIQDFIDYPIVHIILYAYQRNNFKSISSENIYDEQLPINLENNFSTIQPNIFIKDPMICLGMAIESFQTDTAEILCDGKLTYQKKYVDETNETESNRAAANKKILRLRWIHKDEKTGIIAAVEDEAIQEGYEIRWYRHSIGAPSPDQFAGAHWERINDATDSIQIEFNPDVNRQEEQIKAIVLENNNNIQRLVTASKPIIFTNDNEVRNKVTLIDANALSIIFEDDEKGHYFLYDESGEIGKNEDTEVRILTAVFDERPDGERELNVQKKPHLNIDECSKVVWTFPNASMNTMIVPMDSANENAKVLQPDDHGNYIIDEPVQSVGFTIKKQLNNNATQNRIRLDITKDGQDYSAWVDPIFGTAGDNGSDYKVVLTWKNGKNALNLSKEYKLITSQEEFNELNQVYNESGIKQEKNGWVENKYYKCIFLEPYGDDDTQTALIGDVVIFDQAGDVVDWPENAELKADWYVAEFGSSSIKQKEKEEEDIYYPVFKSYNQALNYGLINNPDDAIYQPNEYYYFMDNSAAQSQYYKFVYDDNDEKWKFQPASYTDEIQLYRKRINDNEKKNKLEFRKISFATEPIDQQTGNFQDGHGNNVEPIQIVNNKKTYYYSTNKKYFIKINNQYVLDPWETYQKVETYYEPIEAKEKVYTLDSVGNTVGGLTAAAVNQTVTITANADVSMDSLFILQLTLKNFGDYNLVSYYPIALKDGETRDSNEQMTRIIQYIEGPDRVRYGSSGETDFKKNPYQIRTVQFENEKFVNYYHGYNNDNLQGYWKLLFPNNSESTNFDPVLIESKDIDTRDNNYVSFNKPLLSPSSVYIPDARPYGVQFVEYDSNNNEVTLWTQPILVYQNKYPSRTLNKWNGKDIETDDGAGTITASGFAAGRKERDDNTFTGVVIGDWSRSKADTAITKNTGVYGFNHGKMSYAFKDDGTGFIGKDGSGRIYFDGDKSLIYSSKWKSSAQGMLLDIDDGVIDIRGSYGYIDIDSGHINYPLQIGIGSSPNFKVSWSGVLEAQNATIEGNITANSGTIGNWVIKPVTGNETIDTIIIFDTEENQITKVHPVNTVNIPQNVSFEDYISRNYPTFLDYFSSQGVLQNNEDTNSASVVLSPRGIIYGADLYGGKITGGEIYGGSLNPLLYTTGTGENATTQNQIIELNGYLKVAPLGGLIIPRTSSTSGVESYLGSTTSYVTDDDSDNVYSGGISMRAVVANTGEDQNNFKYINSEVKATGLNSGFSAGKYAAGDPINGYLARVNSYVSAYVDTPSVKMETMSDANMFGGVGVSNYVRTFLSGIQIYAKTKSSGEAVTNAKIEINRENEEIELWANKTIYLKIDNAYFLKIYKDTDDNNKIKIATNIDAANQTGIYARFA